MSPLMTLLKNHPIGKIIQKGSIVVWDQGCATNYVLWQYTGYDLNSVVWHNPSPQQQIE